MSRRRRLIPTSRLSIRRGSETERRRNQRSIVEGHSMKQTYSLRDCCRRKTQGDAALALGWYETGPLVRRECGVGLATRLRTEDSFSLIAERHSDR